MQKGGVNINHPYNPQTAIFFFITNSTCQVFSTSTTGGLLFKLTLNEGVRSPYSATRSNYPNKDVTEIIFKIVFISNSGRRFVIFNQDGIPLTKLSSTTTDEFKNEVSTQIDIFTRSLEINEETNVCYLEPICPSIVYAEININTETILKMLQSRGINQNTKNILTYIILNGGSFSIGFIAMEMMSGFITLDQYIRYNPRNAQMAEQMAMFEIARLFELGYIHGDLNLNNILFDPNYIYFGDGVSGPLGRAILIDFGATFEHRKDPTIRPVDLYSAVQHSITMNSPKFAGIQHESVQDARGLAFWYPSYQWLKLLDPIQEITFKIKLYNLHEKREKAKQKFVAHVMDNSIGLSPGSTYSNPYPQLPEIEMSGGNDSSLIHTPLQKLDTKELDTKELDTKELTQNIFDKLDPEHKLNVKFITDYVKKEKASHAEILESIQKKKGGEKRNKKSKTKRKFKAKRKFKTRKSKTKRIY
jgi:hypothetical protein